MKQLIFFLLIIPAMPAIATTYDVPSGTYVLEETHGYITFSYSHMGFSNPHISFDKFDVTLQADSNAAQDSTVSVNIDAASINSRVDEFDKHLNGKNFFDTSNHPDITFTSTGISAMGENTYAVTGTLTIKGVSKEITLATTINKAANNPMSKLPTIGMSGVANIKRSDFDLGAYVPMVSDEVEIFVTAELIKQE